MDIDEDPFSHFISPVHEEDDPFDNLAYSAGIIVNESDFSSKASKFRNAIAQKWAYYVERNHEGLHEMYHVQPQLADFEDDNDENYMFPHEWDGQKKSRAGVTRTTRPPLTTSHHHQHHHDAPFRDRSDALITYVHPRKRRRTTRTLSGLRHSWREPSDDLFTVLEEADDMLAVGPSHGIKFVFTPAEPGDMCSSSISDGAKRSRS
jgi:hypothetical protein